MDRNLLHLQSDHVEGDPHPPGTGGTVVGEQLGFLSLKSTISAWGAGGGTNLTYLHTLRWVEALLIRMLRYFSKTCLKT